MQLTNEQCWANLRRGDHATLCTLNAKGLIDAVPVCFAVVGKVVASPIDRVKAKDTTRLARLTNLEREATATLLADRWDPDDWSRLWWVRAHMVRRSGHDVSARLLEDCEHALRAKYAQYRGTEFAEVVVFDVSALTGWSAGEEPD
jgi:PPOX class probable F420-dependent enzyme